MIKFPIKYFLKMFLILVLLLPSEYLLAQGQQRELTTSNNRARRAFEDGVHKYNLRDINSAAESFRNAVRIDPEFIEAYIVMGEMFQSAERFEEATEAYQKAIDIDPDFYPGVLYQYAESALAIGKYEDADIKLRKFLEYDPMPDNARQRAENLLLRSDFGMDAMANPVPFEPENLGAAINSPNDEYAPTLTADEQTLIFTRKKPREDSNYLHLGREYEDFYISYRKNGEWTPAGNLGPPINTQFNEGAQSISADGVHLYFTACNRPDGMGSCDIYYARRVDDDWSRPVNLGPPVNTSSWDSQPSISPDGRTLYFVSNRSGNYGRMDIWMSARNNEGKWSQPQNLGPVINTRGREMSPFIHPDNRTLFFASDGHIGMGGMDLFYTVRGDDGEWQKPVNLGYPINTYADEISLVVGASGKEAYFASEQPGGRGGSDLYFFELYEEARPQMVTYMKGFVFDAKSNQRLRAAFELIDLESEEVIVQSNSRESNGEFLIPIPVGRNLALNVWREGYLFFSENFSFEDVRTGVDPHLFDIPLQPIREGESVVLRNVFFRFDSHELLSESIVELSRLFKFLQQNPDIKIEISGHTDSTGSFSYNKTLSENRALSVYNYLVEEGIEKERLSYAGYADTKPVASNETEDGRAKNRRTEFRVTSGG
jgi:outer membrane protein OmpA-like peptidoglycan-associated protein/cytochrome c-type biogenesis protein CcmH/NrfG